MGGLRFVAQRHTCAIVLITGEVEPWLNTQCFCNTLVMRDYKG
jgi:hypothetical protein